MSIFSTIKKSLPFTITRNPQRKQDKSGTGQLGWLNPFIRYGQGDRSKQAKPTWTTYYEAMDNEWIGACIDAYVIDTLAAGFDVYSDDKKKDDPDVVAYIKDLFNRPDGPDGIDTFTKFIMRGVSSHLGPGDWFAECVHDDTIRGLPVGFYFIQPHRLFYYYDTDQWGLVGSGVRYENDELIHIMNPDPWNELYGKSPIDKAAKSITLDILSMDFNKGWFDSGMSPKNFMIFDADIDDSVYTDNIKRVKQQALENPQGTYFLRGGTFQEAGLSNRDMQFTDLQDRIRDRIVASYGVPPQNVGIYTAGSLGNERDNTADKKFKKRLVGKVLRPVEDEFNRVMGKSFDLWGFEERFHFGDIDLEDKQMRANIENMQLRNGTKVVNEIRTGYGLEPTSYGDEPMSYAMGNTGYGYGYGSVIQDSPEPTEPQKSIKRSVQGLDSILQQKGLAKVY